jgi:hypothetical protein
MYIGTVGRSPRLTDAPVVDVDAIERNVPKVLVAVEQPNRSLTDTMLLSNIPVSPVVVPTWAVDNSASELSMLFHKPWQATQTRQTRPATLSTRTAYPPPLLVSSTFCLAFVDRFRRRDIPPLMDQAAADPSQSFASSSGAPRACLPTDRAVCVIQDFTRAWPSQLRYSHNAHIAASDTDEGFERLLREALDGVFPAGDVSGIRDLGLGDGIVPVLVPQHEIDLILRCREGKFVLEAKAWAAEVGKEPVIIFLAKVLDFLASSSFDFSTPVHLGFIGLGGFSEAAHRAMFATGIVPFTKSRPDQIAFKFLDSLLARGIRVSERNEWSDLEDKMRARRAALSPFLALEGRDLCKTFGLNGDSAVVDLDGIRKAAEMFEEGREEHRRALAAYRAFLAKKDGAGA